MNQQLLFGLNLAVSMDKNVWSVTLNYDGELFASTMDVNIVYFIIALARLL